MPVEVVKHPDIWATYHSDLSDPLKDLIVDIEADFIRYKESGSRPDYFGRDAPFVQPALAYKAKLMHIHLAVPPHRFNATRCQDDMCCPVDSPNSDACLVYCWGGLERDRYCLIALLWPNAHGEARRHDLISGLARAAIEWRDQN